MLCMPEHHPVELHDAVDLAAWHATDAVPALELLDLRAAQLARTVCTVFSMPLWGGGGTYARVGRREALGTRLGRGCGQNGSTSKR